MELLSTNFLQSIHHLKQKASRYQYRILWNHTYHFQIFSLSLSLFPFQVPANLMSFEWVRPGRIKHMESSWSAGWQESRGIWRSLGKEERPEMNKRANDSCFVCVGAFPLPSPSLNPTANSSSTTALTSRVWVYVCVKERVTPPAATVSPPLVWPEITRFLLAFTLIYTSIWFPASNELRFFLGSSWRTLHGPLEFVYTFFTLFVAWVLWL